jgi:hypothetical protein
MLSDTLPLAMIAAVAANLPLPLPIDTGGDGE